MITTQKELRCLFRQEHPSLDFRKVNGNFKTDTRCAWVDWIDCMARNGQISQTLAQRATLD
jgi:hypothetical protein